MIFILFFHSLKENFNVGLQEYSYSLKVHIIYSFIYIHSLYVLVLFDVTYCNWKSFHVMLFVVAVITWVSLVFSLNSIILLNLGFESRSDVVSFVPDRFQWGNGDLVNITYSLISEILFFIWFILKVWLMSISSWNTHKMFTNNCKF